MCRSIAIGLCMAMAFPAVALAQGVSGSGAAQIHGTFAAFEARCLTPMIEVRDTDVSGLTRIPHRAAWESWVPDSGDWELRRALPGAVVQFCSVQGNYGPEVDFWVGQAIASGDWTRIDRTPETLQSTFIREPLIEVEIDRAATPTVLTVIETNLES